MVLIPNGGGYYRVICLVEVVWKVVMVILNRHFTASIAFHNAFHGLRAVQGTDNASLEAEMLHQLTPMKEEVT